MNEWSDNLACENEELQSLLTDVYAAALAAGDGNSAAGKWIADRIRHGVDFELPAEGITRLLNNSRPADYWSHG